MDLLATANPTRKFKAINDRNKEFREGDSASVAYAALVKRADQRDLTGHLAEAINTTARSLQESNLNII